MQIYSYCHVQKDITETAKKFLNIVCNDVALEQLTMIGSTNYHILLV